MPRRYLDRPGSIGGDELSAYMHDTLYLMYYTVDTVRISLQSRYGADTVPDTMGMAAMGMGQRGRQ